MSYWDAIEFLHTEHAREFPHTQKAVAAIRGLRALLEPHWKLHGSGGHPLDPLLRMAPHHEELTHLLAKLATLRRIPGHERVLRRLGSSADFTTAWYEADFALKLVLDGHKCRFLEEDGDPHADLLVEVEGDEWEAEVTSLNPPREDELASTLASFASFIPFQSRCVAGGVAFVSKNLSRKSLSLFEDRLREASSRAQTEATCVWVNVPGVITAQVAPRESTHLMDPRYRGSFIFEHETPLPVTRRLSSTVSRKADGQLSGAGPGVLAVYDQLLTDAEERSLAEFELSTLVSTYPNLKAVVLIRPLRWTGPFEPEIQSADGRVWGRHSLPDREGESFIVWPSVVDPRSAERVVRWIKGFPSNLERLYKGAETPA